MKQQRRPKLFACYGYGDDGGNPIAVSLYRDRAASMSVDSIPIDAPAAPKRKDEQVTLRGTVYDLEWLD